MRNFPKFPLSSSSCSAIFKKTKKSCLDIKILLKISSCCLPQLSQHDDDDGVVAE